ncbi:MAG: hypothetical protein ACXVHB_26820 [Solirubrobacteraceae bacterium]
MKLRLSPKQVQALAGFICGGETPWAYRRMVDILSFMRFTGATMPADPEPGSRFISACAFIEHTEASDQTGHSGLSADTEKVLVALLDRREFDNDADHVAAVGQVRDAVAGLPIMITAEPYGIEIHSAWRDKAQSVLEERIHTAFGDVIAGEDLAAARAHYIKARRFLEGPVPDYENCCKESVCSIEALATAMTGERDLPRAIKKAVGATRIPKPLDDMIIKLYAYRGNEPGVGHGQADAPSVRRAEAELLFNLAGSLGHYLRVALTEDADDAT